MIDSPAFVGRARELDQLTGLFDEAAPRLILVGGEAGIGKSRLVAELLAHARRAGSQVLVGSCVNFGTAPPPYLPVIDALRAVSDQLDAETLACLLPDLVDVRDQLTAGQPTNSSQARLFEQLLGTLQELAGLGSLVLVLEDIHWADPSTLDLLSFLVRNVGSGPVLLVATYRTDELHRNHPLRPVLAELRRHRRTEHVELEPFRLEEVRAQLDALFDAPADAAVLRQVFERSDGIPFFVEELAAACDADELPSSVQHVVSAKLDGLSEGARAVVEAAAIAGATVPHPLLATVSGVADGELAAAVREAIGAAVFVLTDDGRSYRFRHALLREVVVAEMLPGDRIRHHAAVAEALECDPDLAEGGPATVMAERAWHWRKANRLVPALHVSIDAAKAAERVYAFQEALAHYEAALELWDSVGEDDRPTGLDRVDLLAAAAEVASLAGNGVRALTLVRKAIDTVPVDDAVLAGSLRTSLAGYLGVLARFQESVSVSEEALAVLPAGPSAPRARALAVLARSRGFGWGLAQARVHAAEAAEMAAEVGDMEAEGMARNTLGLSIAAAGDVDRGASELGRSLELARTVGDLDGIVRAQINLADVHMRGGRFADALALSELGGAELAALGVRLRAGLFLAVNAAECEVELGRWEAAGRRLATVDVHVTSPLIRVHLLLTRGLLAMRSGDLDAAADFLEVAEPEVQEISDAQFLCALLRHGAELALWRSRPAEALELASRGLDDAVGTADPRDVADLLWLVGWAQADAAEVGIDVDVSAVGPELLALLERAGEGAVLHRALAEAERTRSDPRSWEAAASLADAGERPFHAAYARWRQAEAAVGAGLRADATAAVRQAAAAASRLGARHLLAQVTDLARRARLDLDVEVAPVPAAASPLDRFGLTPREEEVLLLVGEGLTNREIGERLFINGKTASVHVSNILAKLGVSSRVQAATLASRLVQRDGASST